MSSFLHIIRARKAGFCMGVALALRKLDEAVATCPHGKVASLGDIIHNPQVLADYAKRGVRRLESPDEAEAGMTVLIRAHGVTREVESALHARGVTVVDATCPRVKEAQLAIASATASSLAGPEPCVHGQEARTLLLYGEAQHPEVRGLVSYAQGPTLVFASRRELEESSVWHHVCENKGRAVLAAQTTQDRPVFDALRKALYAAMDTKLTVLDTICDATRQRQEEVLRLTGQVDAMVVVGGRNSGNTKRLAEIALGGGVPVLLVETEHELSPDFFAGKGIIGLTAGASTPKSLVDAVEARLAHMKAFSLQS